MRVRLAIIGVAVLSAVLATTAVGAASSSRPRDGYYAPLGSNTSSADVELFVIDHGKAINDKPEYEPGLSCQMDSSEDAEGLNPGASYINIYVPPGESLKVAGRKFSYSGPAYLEPSEVPAGVTQPPGTIQISGTFKPASAIKGKKFDKKTVAFSGSVSATLCTTGPSTFADIWSINDK
jgi:hypothetical protein